MTLKPTDATVRRRLRYTDSRGNRQTLTYAQYAYLAATQRFGRSMMRDVGYNSKRTVRLLEERGLITLARDIDARHVSSRWTITGLTHLGQQVLAEWVGESGGE